MGLCVLGACSKAPAQAWIVEDLCCIPWLLSSSSRLLMELQEGCLIGGNCCHLLSPRNCWVPVRLWLSGQGYVLFLFFFCLSFVRKVWEVTGRWPALASPLVVWGSCLSGFVWCRCDCRDLEEVGLVWGVSGKTEGCWIWRCWGIRSQV